MSDCRVVILGAGPAGVGAAFQLRRFDRGQVTVVERNEVVGGNAGSFELGGQRVDFGSHRLHPACDPQILADIRGFLGSDLLERPRHGRIRLRGEWVHFPLQPLDLLLRLDRRFALGACRDMATRWAGRDGDGEESFASVLRGRLGPTICENFYFPYARKIWGREPGELSATQARRRVAANSFAKLLRKLLGRVPGVRPVGFSHYYYPRHGYGRISEAYATAAVEAGACLQLGWTVAGLERPDGEGSGWRVRVKSGDEERVLEADHVWSTIPITAISRLVDPPAPAAVRDAAARIDYRAMLLIYLTLDTDQFTEFDAHYFPGSDVSLTRLSEPKNYSEAVEPASRTTLCAELPCDVDDDRWAMGDEQLGTLIAGDLERSGIPLPGTPRVHVRRLRFAYPIYACGYEEHFGVVDAWVRGLPRFLSFGRQGLFAHDNTHHALAMAYAAADCLVGGELDQGKWATYRRQFETHVVED